MMVMMIMIMTTVWTTTTILIIVRQRSRMEVNHKDDGQANFQNKNGHKLNLDLSVRDHLVGLVVKASASRAKDPGLESRLRRDFSRSSHT